ncbi:hypothetical protein Psuf_090910 [Phytohabitans suffuscus]|uniref:Uncharacterized protein n=1 Tax=Phytohabitans suffuscus TaxID=624315 RepID=A0A6F8Z0R3_9ACTN|nr:hypothetical protein Psuf_090910 [Phytohabitans suffuscus]
MGAARVHDPPEPPPRLCDRRTNRHRATACTGYYGQTRTLAPDVGYAAGANSTQSGACPQRFGDRGTDPPQEGSFIPRSAAIAPREHGSDTGAGGSRPRSAGTDPSGRAMAGQISEKRSPAERTRALSPLVVRSAVQMARYAGSIRYLLYR